MGNSKIHRESGAVVGRLIAAMAATIAVMVGVYTFAQPSGGEEEVLVDTGALEQPDASVSDTLEIVVEMDEFSYLPDPIRLPAGRPVKLVVQNVGVIAHEIMIGRDVENGDFEHDLFAGVPVRIEGAGMSMDMSMDMMGGKANEDEHAAQETEEAAHTHEDGDEAHEDAAPDHGHEGGGHGTMALVQPGETAFMTFTIPTDKTGEWTAACFLPGHYEAGMQVDLIVE